jgi:hypothetical protein
MLFNNFKFGSETAVSRARSCKRSVAVIACVSVLAGCESLPDMPDFPSFTDMKTGLSETFNETVTSIEKSWENEPEPGKDAVEQKNEVVTLGRPAVKRLQARLASLGFRSGAVDGIYGSQTAKAVKRYQTAHRLPVTGKVTSGFLEHLDTTIASGNAGHMLTNSPY